jgi:predicted ATPase/class 3 adenylate cyclase
MKFPSDAIPKLPTGTVTFLFTDIQGSTPLWEREPEKMAEALQIHNTALRGSIEANGGAVFKTIGDAFQASFDTAQQALKAAIEGQLALRAAQWNELGELKVRMGLHTGEAELDPGGDEYAVSHTKNRIGRIHSVAHGGQILLSEETADLVKRKLPEGVTLKDMGEHRLKGMEWLEHLYQACAPGLPQDFPPLATTISHPHNLPVQRTSFIGREAQVNHVKELVGRHALVTLTGSGGVGKTRLSLQVARELLDEFPDGVWLVELAPVTDPGLVVQAVAATLGLRTMTSQSLHEILLEYLQNRQVLLVIDNCEHLIANCAVLVDELLRACSKIKILASSREALGVVGEMPYRVPSMTLPDPAHRPELAELEQCEAVRLFSERARPAKLDFRVTAENAAAVTQICQRLDGIPLALELAAARLSILTLVQIASRLDQAFRLLTGGARTALPRQQTLRATIDWSYQLLSEDEKKMLRCLAIFVGSFDLPAVEALGCIDAAEQIESLDLLDSLARKSILNVERPAGSEARYRLLETVRQYAREKLYDAGESEQLHELHAAYYLDLAQQGGRNMYTRQGVVWLRRLDVELANIRQAFNWALAGSAFMKAVQALNTLGWYWYMRCELDEGYAWMEKALERLDPEVPSLERAGLLCELGLVSLMRPLSVSASQRLNLSRELFQELGDQAGYARATMWLGMTFYRLDWNLCLGCYAESAEIFRRLGDDEGLALSLWMSGWTLRDKGDIEQCELHLRECERLYREMGSWKLGDCLNSLADLYDLKGQAQEARSLYKQALPLLQEVDDRWAILIGKMSRGKMELKEAVDRQGLLQAQELLLESEQFSRKLGRRYWYHLSALILLGKTAHKLGEYSQAVSWHREALGAIQDFFLGEESNEWGECLFGLAETEASLEHLTRSARLLGALDGLRSTKTYLWKTLIPADFERTAQAVRTALGEEAFDQEYTAGKGMTLEQALAYALEGKDSES